MENGLVTKTNAKSTLTARLVAESLYFINKKAKEQLHNAKNGLYVLKHAVLLLANEMHLLKEIGFHRQVNADYANQKRKWEEFYRLHGYNDYEFPKECFYFKLYEFCGFQFHDPIDSPEGKYLGDLKVIPSNRKVTKANSSMTNLILYRFLNGQELTVF